MGRGGELQAVHEGMYDSPPIPSQDDRSLDPPVRILLHMLMMHHWAGAFPLLKSNQLLRLIFIKSILLNLQPRFSRIYTHADSMCRYGM